MGRNDNKIRESGKTPNNRSQARFPVTRAGFRIVKKELFADPVSFLLQQGKCSKKFYNPALFPVAYMASGSS
jgi:hypothetical protein